MAAATLAMISHRLARLRPRLSALVGAPRSIVAARLSSATSCAHRDDRQLGFGWRCSLRTLPSSYPTRQYSPTPRLASNQMRLYGSSSDRDARERGSRGRGELQYARIGGPIDMSVCDLSETEIHNLLSARLQCKRARDYQRADKIQDELRRHGVVVDDKLKEWRADGKASFERMRMSPPNRRTDGHSPQRSSSRDAHKMPRMKDCQTMDEAILAIHDNLSKASNRDISAFWAVVPRLLGRGQRTREPLSSKLTSIFNKTAEKMGSFGPVDLSTTALAFAKVTNHLDKVSRAGGPYHQCLQGILADRREVIFQFIAGTAVPVLARFDVQGLANLANAYGLVDHVPKLDDGSTLFHRIAENAIPQMGKFKPQALSITVWAFEKTGVSHPQLFEKVADHIVGLERLDNFLPQTLSNTLNAYAKAGVSHPALFEKVADHIVGLEHLVDFNPQALANTLNAYARAKVSHPALFEKVADHIVGLEHLVDFNPQALANTVHAFAKAKVPHPALFEKVADHIVGLDRLHDYNGQALSNIVWAFATAGVSHPQLFEKVGDHIVGLDRLHEFKSQEMSNTMWAFATAKVSHPALFEKVANHIISLKDTVDFTEQEIANLAWAYQTAGVKNGRLADYLLISAVEKKDEFSERTIKNFLYWTEEKEDNNGSGGRGT